MEKTEKRGSIVYAFATPHDRKANTLYINLIRRYECPNSCRFCSRKDAIRGNPNTYEKKAGASLFLKEAPQIEEIIREVETRMKNPTLGVFGGTKEIAFVGLGEPLTQFNLVCKTMRMLRSRGYRGRIRIDTNGLIKCMRPGMVFGCLEFIEANPAREMREAGLTDVRISMNATNAWEYEALCKPPFEDAFEKLREFVKDCINEGIRTFVSFVVGFADGGVVTKSAHEYVGFAQSLGINRKNVIIRKYVPPILNEGVGV